MTARNFTSEDGPEDGPEGHESEAFDAAAAPTVEPCGWNGSLKVWRDPVRQQPCVPMPPAIRARLRALRDELARQTEPATPAAAMPPLSGPFNLPQLRA